MSVYGPRDTTESNKLLKSQRLAHGIGQTILPGLLAFVPPGLEEQQVRIVAFSVRHATTEGSHQTRELGGPPTKSAEPPTLTGTTAK